MRRAWRWCGLAFVLLAAGCRSSLGPIGPLDGAWSGSSGGPYALNIDLQLTDRGGKLTGGAVVSGPGISGGPASMAVSGTESGGQFSMAMTSPDLSGPLDLSGSVVGDTLRGNLSTPALGSLGGIAMLRQ